MYINFYIYPHFTTCKVALLQKKVVLSFLQYRLIFAGKLEILTLVFLINSLQLMIGMSINNHG